MRRPLIAGNWKMYKLVNEAADYAQALKPLVVQSTHCDIVIAPPYTALKAVSSKLDGSNIAASCQDVAAEPGFGAFTGEVSAEMARDAGAAYAVIGHSERRQYFAETDGSVNRKVFSALGAGLLPVVCVGETLDERDNGQAQNIVGRQLSAGLANLTPQQASRIIIAYEPVWAIGTGRTATPETAQQMHAFIRSRLKAMFGEDVAQGIRILYGGSVKPDNIGNLMDELDIDGALVGGSSLDAVAFARIVNYREPR
jgi:triosephosphate isomerase